MNILLFGLSLSIVGWILHMGAVSVRWDKVKNRVISHKKQLPKAYKRTLIASIVGSTIAFFGFVLLIINPDKSCTDYNIILTVLSLLSAGIISGFFSFSYQKAHKEERCLPKFL